MKTIPIIMNYCPQTLLGNGVETTLAFPVGTSIEEGVKKKRWRGEG